MADLATRQDPHTQSVQPARPFRYNRFMPTPAQLRPASQVTLKTVFTVSFGVLAVTGWRPGRQLALVSTGFALGAIADSWSLYWSAIGHSGATVLDVLGPGYAPKGFRGIHIDNSVLEDDVVEEKAEILKEGEAEARRLAAAQG